MIAQSKFKDVWLYSAGEGGSYILMPISPIGDLIKTFCKKEITPMLDIICVNPLKAAERLAWEGNI